MIRVECTCGEVFSADDSHVGKHVRCRRCGRTVEIARVEPGPVPAVGAAPRSPQPAAAPAPTPASPPRRQRSPASTVFGYVLGAAAVLVAIAGVRAWLETPEPPPPSAPPAALAPPAEVPSAAPAPAPPCDARPRPWSGAMLGRSDLKGKSYLAVDNGTGEDAVVVLVDAVRRRPRYAMFVRRSEQATLRGVSEGSYMLRFQLGEQLSRRGGFCASAGSQEFDEPFHFYVTDLGDSLGVMSHSVTLHRVKGGNAPSHPVQDSAIVLP